MGFANLWVIEKKKLNYKPCQHNITTKIIIVKRNDKLPSSQLLTDYCVHA